MSAGPTSTGVLVVAAEARELRGVAARPKQASLRFWAESEQGRWIADGPGPAIAEAATRAGLSGFRASCVVSTGFCGGLNPVWKVGQILLAREIVEASTGRRFACQLPSGEIGQAAIGRLLSVDRVVQSVAERRYWFDQGFDAVEMEAAGVAKVAEEKQLPLYAVRVISDAGDESLSIDFNQARGTDGRFRVSQILTQALRHPWSGLPELWRLKRRSEECAVALGDFLQRVHYA